MDNLLYWLVYTRLQELLPVKSGNLRYNGFRGRQTDWGASYFINMQVAPYFEYLDKGQGPVKRYEGLFLDMLSVAIDEVAFYHNQGTPYLKKKLSRRQNLLQQEDNATRNATRDRERDRWLKQTRGIIY